MIFFLLKIWIEYWLFVNWIGNLMNFISKSPLFCTIKGFILNFFRFSTSTIDEKMVFYNNFPQKILLKYTEKPEYSKGNAYQTRLPLHDRHWMIPKCVTFVLRLKCELKCLKWYGCFETVVRCSGSLSVQKHAKWLKVIFNQRSTILCRVVCISCGDSSISVQGRNERKLIRKVSKETERSVSRWKPVQFSLTCIQSSWNTIESLLRRWNGNNIDRFSGNLTKSACDWEKKALLTPSLSLSVILMQIKSEERKDICVLLLLFVYLGNFFLFTFSSHFMCYLVFQFTVFFIWIVILLHVILNLDAKSVVIWDSFEERARILFGIIYNVTDYY